MGKVNKKKLIVIDTSVLLYDMRSIHSFSDNEVVIPLIVLDELDKFKDKSGLLGESARYINRFLDFLRAHGDLNNGIQIPGEEQIVRVELNSRKNSAIEDFDWSKGDNKIIATALYLQDTFPDRYVKVITKDVNLRVKCDALKIHAEDYLRDNIAGDQLDIPGWRELTLTNEDVDLFHSQGFLETENDELYSNQFVVGKSNSGTFIGMFCDGKIKKLCKNISSVMHLEPKNKEQKFAVEALMSQEIPLVTMTGLAGSGKTFLALMAGLEQINTNIYDRIIITRSIQPVGRDLGYLPGDVNEKMGPWMAPIVDNLRVAFKDTVYFSMMIEKGEIEIAPLSYIRGRTFNNAIVLVDEAQNATIHELKTIITRIGTNSKIILLGDTDQIDTPYINKRSNGLSNVISKFKLSGLHAHIHLSRGQRSDLASVASEIL